MDFSVHIVTISMGLPIVYFKGSQVEFLNYDAFLSGKRHFCGKLYALGLLFV